MKLAVLGATGSVGRELVTQALAAGHEVTALVREQPKPRGSGSTWGMAAPPSWDTQPYRQVQAPELRRLARR